MHAPGTEAPPAPAILATVVPAAAEASAAVTRVHASTLAITVGFGDGVGVGLGEGVEDEPEDPHALTMRPATANRVITRPAERLILRPVSQRDHALSSDQIKTSTALGGGMRSM